MHLGTDGIHRCYGYIVEQAETQFAGVTTTLGIAVSIDVLRSITSSAGSWRSSIGILRHVPRLPLPPPHQPKPTHSEPLGKWPNDDLGGT